VVVFLWGTPAHEMFGVLRAADGRLERTTWFGNIWVVAVLVQPRWGFCGSGHGDERFRA